MKTFCKFIKEGLLERELTGTRIIKSTKMQWNVHHKQFATVGGVRALVITINYSNLASTCKVHCWALRRCPMIVFMLIKFYLLYKTSYISKKST